MAYYSTKVSTKVKEAQIGRLIWTPSGRAKIAASMIQPLRLRRDYTAVARKTFLVEELPDGALSIYDKDPDVTAYLVGEEGQSIVSIAKPRRVHAPLFELACNPEIPLTQIKERRYDLIDRCQDLGKAQIQAAEDERGFAILDAIAVSGFDTLPGGTNPDVLAIAPVSPGILADAFAEIERHDLRVARIFMNAVDYADIRKFGRDILDPQSQANLLGSGLQAALWGAQIITSRLVPAGYIYLCCEPEMFGRFPVRTELTVLSADDSKARTIGFSIFENVGMLAFNPRGETRVVVTR